MANETSLFLIMEHYEKSWSVRSKHYGSELEETISIAEKISRKSGRFLSVWKVFENSARREMIWNSRWGHLKSDNLDKGKLLFQALTLIYRHSKFTSRFPETILIAKNLGTTRNEVYQILLTLVEKGFLAKSGRKFVISKKAAA